MKLAPARTDFSLAGCVVAGRALPSRQPGQPPTAHEPPGRHVASQADYDQIQRLLIDAHAHAEAAEAHGTLAGALCAAPGYRFEDWLAEILPEGAASAAIEAILARLFDETRDALLEAQLELQLLIPELVAALGGPQEREAPAALPATGPADVAPWDAVPA